NLTIVVRIFVIFLISTVCLCSCKVYKQNILFNTDDELLTSAAQMAVHEAESSYIIKPYDYLQIEVFTNKGERIIDPNFELVEENLNNRTQSRPQPKFLVQDDGMVMLPIVGEINLAGLTLPGADSVLRKEYSNYYKEPYVITTYTNKRVIVLGATGGQVIPLENEQMSVIEVVALAGGIPNEAKGHNIRLIRGDLKNPTAQVIDLTTIQGLRNAE